MRTHTQATINGNWFGVWCVRRPPSHLNKKKRNETEMCAFFSSIMPIAICSNSAIECEWMNHIIESAPELLAHRMQICNLWVFVKQWLDSFFFFHFTSVAFCFHQSIASGVDFRDFVCSKQLDILFSRRFSYFLASGEWTANTCVCARNR